MNSRPIYPQPGTRQARIVPDPSKNPYLCRAMVKADNILSQHKLRITPSRLSVLDAFMGSHHALSQPDLEKLLEQSCDRVTIYRTLESFMKSGILHKVPDNEGRQKYALCDSCDDHHHHDEHLHFKCTNCGRTECLDEIPMPRIDLPQGYTVNEWNLLLQGKCSTCS